jgi:hypothetical protein
VTELVGDRLRRAQLTVSVEFLASFDGRERLARCGGRIRRADPRSHPGELTVAA